MNEDEIDAMVAQNLVSGAYDRYFYFESAEPLLCPQGHVAIPAGERRYVFTASGNPLHTATFDDAFCVICSECYELFNLAPSWDDEGPIHAQSEKPPPLQRRQVFYGRIER